MNGINGISVIWSNISNNIQIMGSIICMCLAMHDFFCGILYMGQYLSIWINLYMIRSLWMGLMGLIWSKITNNIQIMGSIICMFVNAWRFFVEYMCHFFSIWINLYMIRSLWMGLMGLIWSKISNNIQIMGSIICMCMSMHGFLFLWSIWVNIYQYGSICIWLDHYEWA